MIGTTIGPYVVERELGRGGMGVVYAARHVGLNQRVAIKVLLPELSGDPGLIDRFFGEAQAAAASRHPGIVQILDADRLAGAAYIVMEFLDGESLSTRVARCAPLPVPEVLAMARQLASALSAAHAAGVVHRDLKPDNVHVVPDPDMPLGERSKILDFGIAKIATHLAGRGGHTRTGVVMGTPSYMSPEQCRGAGAVDHRSDLYSLGCIVFEMLTGQPPFPGEVGEVIGAHQYQPARAVRALRPDVPRGLDRLVAALLAKDPADRPASAAALVSMPHALAQRTTTGPRVRDPAGAIDRARPKHTTMSAASGEASGPIAMPRRWPRIAAVGALVATAGIALALTVPHRGRSTRTAAAAPAALDASRPISDDAPAEPSEPTVVELRLTEPDAATAVAIVDAGAPPIDAAPPVPRVEPPAATRSDRRPKSAAAAPAAASTLTAAEVDALVADAEATARAGSWSGAATKALAALRAAPDNTRAVTVLALAACHQGDAALAATLSKRLPATRATAVRSACARLQHRAGDADELQ